MWGKNGKLTMINVGKKWKTKDDQCGGKNGKLKMINVGKKNGKLKMINVGKKMEN